jgi:uncharacterized membrane protein
MNLPDNLLPFSWLVAAWVLYVPLLMLALRAGALREFAANPARLNVFSGTCLAVMLLWMVHGSVGPGLNFHLLGATIVTLMFGPWRGLIVLALALLGVTVTIAGRGGWWAFAVNGLLMTVIPVVGSALFFRWVDRRLSNHFFVYIFVAAFLNGALAMALNGVAAVSVLYLAGVRSAAYLFTEYLPYYALLAWAEALTTGMIMTLLVVYRPAWVATFDDKRYLIGR